MSPTSSQTTNFLRDAIENSPKTQREIAKAVGFAHPNALSMMETGETKVPINRIPALAAALDVDTRRFLKIALREYHPEIWMTLDEFLRPNLSQMEEDILETYHIALIDYDIPWTEELKGALTAVFELAAKTPEDS